MTLCRTVYHWLKGTYRLHKDVGFIRTSPLADNRDSIQEFKRIMSHR